RRQKPVEPLPGRECDHVLVLSSNTTDARDRVVPPLLRQQKGLVDQAERQLLPAGIGEATVLGQRVYAWLDVDIGDASRRVVREAQCLFHRLFGELRAFAWRE